MTNQKITIVKVDGNGVGVGYVDDRAVLVPYTLTSEIIELRKVENMGKYSECTDYCIVHSSDKRVDAKCQYFGKCGGCQLQHMNYTEQVRLKTQKVLDNLKYVAGIDTRCEQFFEADSQYNYRNKMVFVVSGNKCGMYQPKSHNFVEINHCEIASEGINKIFALISNWVSEYNPPINHIAIRQVSDKFLCVIITNYKCDTSKLVTILDHKFKGKYQLVININDSKKELITNKLIKVAGADIIDDTMQFRYPISANSFMQVNSEVSNKLYYAVLDEIDGDTVINAYSGAGYLTAMLSKRARKVYGVELVANAHKDAEKLRRDNALDNVINICGRAEIEVPKILSDMSDKVTIVVDPPRSGVANDLLHIFNDNDKISKIVYISCDSLSLAKNLRLLTNYQLTRLKLADMFPQTTHVETLAILQRKKY